MLHVCIDKFPDDEYITSYVTSTNPNNRYVNLANFYVKMKQSYGKNWKKRFIHVANDAADNKRIAEAAEFATDIVLSKTAAYGVRSGWLFDSVTTLVNGVVSYDYDKAIIASSAPPIFEVTNFAEYASTVEARSYFSAQAGIIYYAARRTQTKYPDLGILFYFTKAATFGLPHIYDVPVLRIALPVDATGKWGRPGTNARRRIKAIRSINARSKRNAT